MTSLLYRFVLVIGLNIQPVTALSTISGSEPFDLHFSKTSVGYAILQSVDDPIPDMMSFSVCLWIKLYISASGATVTLLSYSNSIYEKALLLDTQGYSINIYMDDMNQLFPRIDLTDKKWHHACILWDQTVPRFRFYFEGVKDATPDSQSVRKVIGLKGGGTLVIGARKSAGPGNSGFIDYMDGSISNLNIWNRYLTQYEAQKVYSSCDLNRGNVMYWCEHVIAPMLRMGATIVSPSTACSSLCADATFTRQANFKLMGHEITKNAVRDEFTCASYCLRSCNCQSFNLSKRSANQFTCELNNATEKQFPRDLIFTGNDDDTYHAMLID